jgi:hypothetical protein
LKDEANSTAFSELGRLIFADQGRFVSNTVAGRENKPAKRI